MKLQRYFIFLRYKGTGYHGWQTQPGEKTVQGVIEKSLSVILQEKISVTGAGRTDTGVHASYFVAHLDSSNLKLTANKNILFRLNRFLPKDITISEIKTVKKEAHARFDALSRTYEYHIAQEKEPFLNEYSWYRYGISDIEKMNMAALYLREYNDFTSFSKKHTDVKTFICRIDSAEWFMNNRQLVFKIKADRFLRNMVRAIVGTMIDIGTGIKEPEEIRNIIESKNRSMAGVSAPAEGLFLTDIEYPDNIFSY